MKIKHLAWLILGFSIASADDFKFDLLYADSTVNKELHTSLFPIPDKYEALKSVIISNTELDSIARNEMGKTTVFKISGQSLSGKYLSVGKEGVAFGENLVNYQDIDYIQYSDRKSFGGFLTTVAGVGFVSALFFGGMEVSNLIFRGHYDYMNVLTYTGFVSGITAVFYFPISTTNRIGFKLK